MPVAPQSHILIVDADESVRFTFQRFLNKDGFDDDTTSQDVFHVSRDDFASPNVTT